MTAPVSFLLALFGLIGAANARLNAVVLGRPVSIPVLGLAAVLVGLALAVALLLLIRILLRDGLRLRPGTVT